MKKELINKIMNRIINWDGSSKFAYPTEIKTILEQELPEDNLPTSEVEYHRKDKTIYEEYVEMYYPKDFKKMQEKVAEKKRGIIGTDCPYGNEDCERCNACKSEQVEKEYKKLIPINIERNEPNNGVSSCNKEGIYKNDMDYFFTTDAYIRECEEQGVKALTIEDLKEMGFTEERTVDNRRLADKLGLKLSGYIDSYGKWRSEGGYGCLCSASPVNKTNMRAFEFSDGRGGLNYYYNRYDARPCLFLAKNSSDNSTIEEQADKKIEKLGMAYIGNSYEMETVFTNKINEIIDKLNGV